MNQSPVKRIAFLEPLVILMMALILVVDSINGLTMRYASFSISAPFKLVLLTLVVILLNRWRGLLAALLAIMAFVLAHTIILRDILMAMISSSMLIKLLAIIPFYYLFRRLVLSGREQIIFRLALLAILIVGLNIGIGMLGYGYAQYNSASGSTIGSRGLFYSGNELSVTYVVAVSLVLIKLTVDKCRAQYILAGAAFLSLSIFTATKVTILSVLLLFVSFPIISLFDKRLLNFMLSRRKLGFIVLISILFPVLLFGSGYLVLYKINLIERLEHFYATSTFVDVALSGRNVRAVDALRTFATDYSDIELLFGRGSFWGGGNSLGKLIEIDPLDMLMNYGVIGLALLVFVGGAGFLFAFRFAEDNPYSKFVIFTLLLLIGVSLTAGHVIYSASAGYLIGALVALGDYRYAQVRHMPLTS